MRWAQGARVTAIADRGYYSGLGPKACEDAGIAALVPKPMTSNARAEGRFDKSDFIYITRDDEYQCPAGQRAIRRFSREGWTADQHLLVQCLSWLLDEGAMHNRRVPTHQAMGARGSLGSGPAKAGPDVQRHDGAQEHHRACLRHSQTLDGLDALPNPGHRERGHRDEPEHVGIQLQTRPQRPGLRADQEGDACRGQRCPLGLLRVPSAAPNRLQHCLGGLRRGGSHKQTKLRAASDLHGLRKISQTASLPGGRS